MKSKKATLAFLAAYATIASFSPTLQFEILLPQACLQAFDTKNQDQKGEFARKSFPQANKHYSLLGSTW